ncbi:MAG TPA: tetratricopeptide repeat protein [Candidatus Solibacter sp.]|nr:tetratricopeptide repeat protein [Candidatus Solibacter sp.]
MYNRNMNRLFHLFVGVAASLVLSASSIAQSPSKAPSEGAAIQSGLKRAMALAESGHCAEALPLLKRAIHQVSDRDSRKRIGLLGLNCAMTHNQPYDSLDFLSVLHREFPGDPDVLYAAAHAYSDLSLRASKDLVREAPFSYQVHELNAEALETQGRWQEAAAEYEKIIGMDPTLRGIHARLGRALLSAPQPAPEDVAKAKKAFQDELEIDPNNATAEYVLGDLAHRDGDLSSAVAHFTRATKIDAGFAEAFLGLGSTLVERKQYADAISPLETYEKIAPDSPTGHYQLALAYNGLGRKEDANREAALQRDTAKTLEQLKRRVAEGLEQQKPPQ